MQRLITFLVLLGLFLPSVYVRKSYFQEQPSAENHAALPFLITMDVWNMRSPSEYHFCPVITYTSSGDKFNTSYARLEDAAGNNYYSSGLPAFYIGVFYLFKLLQLPFSYSYLVVLSMLIHFLAGILIYYLASRMWPSLKGGVSSAGIAAFLIYTYSSACLAMYGYIIFGDMASQLPWLVLLNMIFSVISTDQRPGLLQVFAFLIVSYIFLLTDSIAFICLPLVWYLLYKKGGSNIRSMLLIIPVAFIFAAITLFVQYTSIGGFVLYLKSILLRALERSGYGGVNYSGNYRVTSGSMYESLFTHIHNALCYIGYLLLLVLFWVRIKIPAYARKTSPANKLILNVTLVTALVHTIVFLNYSALHFYSFARFAPFFALLLAYLYQLITHYLKVNKWVLSFVFMLVLILSLWNFNLKKGNTLTENEQLVRLTEQIRPLMKPDQALIVCADSLTGKADYFLSYMLKRNVVVVSDMERAKQHVKRLKANSCLVISAINNRFESQIIERDK